MRTIIHTLAIHLGVLSCLFIGSANAAIIKNIEFNSAGILPSSESDIEFFNNTSSTETSLYSVSGGLLQQQTLSVNGNASYHFPDTVKPGSEFDASLTTIIEARLRVVDIVGLAGAYFQAFDGGNRYSAFFEPTGLSILTPTGNQSFSINVFDFHTYRLVSPANSDALNLFVDGTLVANVTAAANSLNGFGFGDGITALGNGANVEWDYVRVSQVPIPTSIWLFLSGLISVYSWGLRRIHRRST